ncbi:uncharacterized protein GLRG_11618 [Colletotrichum graminicola M1.001]|uniref:Uncharacterized protein n=1 Tax=Colletotrichum graminicola (strain M1.001 / M2 / FGSC 10212) TaxID=645133 RepID=E3R035_COLGM|nr:uncharacterized protein GLRG_11618 [Colletotrichum graminicola M1.001]EFQ36473.1 hypothetical protein GLRG_11618 [Colletotrichum graminicola M1.001]
MSNRQCCFGNNLVPNYLRWLYNDKDLPITFRKEAPNVWDCGVYALVFASHVADGKPLPMTIDGARERVYLRHCMLVSHDRALASTESNGECRTLRAQAEAAKHLNRRMRNFDELLQDGSDDLLKWMARKEVFREGQAALADAIATLHNMHLMTVESATRAETQAANAKGLKDFHKALKTIMCMNNLAWRDQHDCSLFKLSDSTIRHLNIVQDSSRLLDKDLTQLLETDNRRDLADETRLGYRECSALIIVLNYAVRKFRENATDMKRRQGNAHKELQGHL